MTNKISGYQTAEPLPPAIGQGVGASAVEKPEAAGPSPAAGTPPSGDHVTITEAAIALQKLGAVLESTPVVNSSKVAAVKQAVQSGTYKIDTARVADKILQFENELK